MMNLKRCRSSCCIQQRTTHCHKYLESYKTTAYTERLAQTLSVH